MSRLVEHRKSTHKNESNLHAPSVNRRSCFVASIARCQASSQSSNTERDSCPLITRYRARVSYDGTEFCGWQFQVSSKTVQGEIEKAIQTRIGQLVRVVGASRTDSGVHAKGQGAHFDIPQFLAPDRPEELRKFELVINHMLPSAIRVSHVEEAPCFEVREQDDGSSIPRYPRLWNAIFDAKGKLYTYRICVAKSLDPMERLYRVRDYHIDRFGFSEEKLRQGAAKFVGTHDFSAYANHSAAPPGFKPAALVNPIRTVHEINVIDEGDGRMRLDFRIDGALYRMIRNIMGTLLKVACNQLEVSAIDEFFASKDRRIVPKSAPAKGLCLEQVFYDDWEM